jgi:hypothetical protein
MEKLTSIQQVNSAIMFGTWTDVELRSMADAIRFNQISLRKQVKPGRGCSSALGQ